MARLFWPYILISKLNCFNMKNTAFISLFFVLLVSCKNMAQKPGSTAEIKKETFPITIKVDEARSNLEIPLLSNFSDDVTYIKLKPPPTIIIKDIRDVQISKGNIFIHEGLSQKVIVFDKDGKFIKQIGRIGRGPNEYINLRSFCFDKNNEDLFFYTGNSGYVFKFKPNGELIEKLFRFPFADQMYFLNNIFIFSGFAGPTKGMPDGITQFATTDRLGQKIDSVPSPIYSINNWRKKMLWFSGNYSSTIFNGILLLYGWGEDTLYHAIRSGKIESRYFLDFGKYNNPIETRYIAGSPDIQKKRNLYISAISPPFETANNLWWKFALQKEAFLLRYDKIKQKAFTFFYNGEKEIDLARGRNSLNELGLVNDIDGGPDFFPDWSVYDDSTQLFVAAKEAFDLKKELTPEYFKNKEIKFRDKKDKLLELVNNLEEKDDYVLMVVKLK
jgi:hypothetical protein